MNKTDFTLRILDLKCGTAESMPKDDRPLEMKLNVILQELVNWYDAVELRAFEHGYRIDAIGVKKP